MTALELCARVPLFLQIDNCPVLLALLHMAEIQVNCLMPAQTAGEQQGQECAITLFLQAIAIGRLPLGLRLFRCKPVS